MKYAQSTSCYLISKCAQILFISVAFLNTYYLIYCSFASLTRTQYNEVHIKYLKLLDIEVYSDIGH